MSVSLPDDFRALVVGASGALGAAFLQHLAQSTRCGELVGVSRSAGDFDLEIPASLEALGRSLSQRAPFHLIVDATGALTLDDVGPEKSLAKLEWAALNRSLLVNVSGPALLLRHLAPLLANGDAIYAKLYGLTTEELRYILDPQDVYGPDFPGETFRVLKEKEIRLYGEYRTRRLVLKAWERLNA